MKRVRVFEEERVEIIEAIRRGLPAERLIAHRYGIEDAQSAFRAFFSGEGLKAAIHPWEA